LYNLKPNTLIQQMDDEINNSQNINQPNSNVIEVSNINTSNSLPTAKPRASLSRHHSSIIGALHDTTVEIRNGVSQTDLALASVKPIQSKEGTTETSPIESANVIKRRLSIAMAQQNDQS